MNAAILDLNWQLVNNQIIANEHVVHRRALRRKRMYLRNENAFFDLPDVTFRTMFRVTKEIFDFLLNVISPYLKEGTRRGSISKRMKVSIPSNVTVYAFHYWPAPGKLHAVAYIGARKKNSFSEKHRTWAVTTFVFYTYIAAPYHDAVFVTG